MSKMIIMLVVIAVSWLVFAVFMATFTLKMFKTIKRKQKGIEKRIIAKF